MPDQEGVTPQDAGTTEFNLDSAIPESIISALGEDVTSSPYFSEMKSMNDVFSKLDGSQKLIGRRVAPEDSSDETAWDEHYAKIRPENFADYEVPESIGKGGDVFADEIKKAIHSGGLSKAQADKLLPGISSALVSLAERTNTANSERYASEDTDLRASIQKKYGSDAEQVTRTANDLLTKFGGEGLNIPDTFDNTQMHFLMDLLSGISKQYMSEDDLPAGDGGSTSGGTDLDTLRSQRQELTKKMNGISDPFSSEINILQGQYDSVSDKIEKLLTRG